MATLKQTPDHLTFSEVIRLAKDTEPAWQFDADVIEAKRIMATIEAEVTEFNETINALKGRIPYLSTLKAVQRILGRMFTRLEKEDVTKIKIGFFFHSGRHQTFAPFPQMQGNRIDRKVLRSGACMGESYTLFLADFGWWVVAADRTRPMTEARYVARVRA